MTKRNTITEAYHADPSTFGGKIYKGDFYGCHYMSNIASQIVSDWKFDEQCRKNAENRFFQ